MDIIKKLLIVMIYMSSSVYSASWSPDGSKIAYSYIANPENIYLVNADGSDPQTLLARKTRDFRPEWSADGKHLIFTSVVDGAHVISKINIDGSDYQQLTKPEQALGDPEYYHKDEWLLGFTDEPIARDIIIKHTTSKITINLTSTPNFEEKSPRWSKDGRFIFYVGKNKLDKTATDDIWQLELATGQNRNLTNSLDINEFHPTVSYDGNNIAYIQVVNDEFQLSIFNLNSGQSQVLANGNGYAILDPHFSPDNKWISFIRTDFAEKKKGLPSINKVHIQSGEEKLVTQWK